MLVEKPRAATRGADIRFLDQAELEALLRAAPDGALGRVDRLMWLTAAMTGLRQGELLALRWRDVDWLAGRLRIRQSFVRGEFGTPKSHRSSCSVPLADSRRRRARSPPSPNRVPGRRRPGLRPPAARNPARALAAAEALQARGESGRHPRHSF